MRPRVRIDRRQFLTALGLGGTALALPGTAGWLARATAQESPAPRRVVFWVTPHGTVWRHWNMNLPGLGSGTSQAPLASVDRSSFSPILAPLYDMRSKITPIEGISRAVETDYEYRRHTQDGYDLNRHHFGQAGLMTCVDPRQRSGTTCIGGGISIDQVIGNATTAPGRWASRVYGANHQHPYSFVAAGEASPRTSDPQTAFRDIMGLYVPPEDPEDPEPDPALVRAAAIRRARGSVLDFAAQEFDRVAPRLGRADREKLERHAQLIRDLELTFAGGPGTTPGPGGAVCDPTFQNEGDSMDRFARIITLALSCDMTRVVTYVTPAIGVEDFAPEAAGSGINLHQDWAHCSIDGADCYSTAAEDGMRRYNEYYAARFSYLLEQLDSVPEGDGTVLDHTAVVWITELATGTHDLDDFRVVIGGGGRAGLLTGHYLRFARDSRIRGGWGSQNNVGPGHNRLYVTLMQLMGMTENTFGATEAQGLTLTGSLDELLT